MSSLRLEIKDEIAILTFDQPDSKVNVLNTQTMTELSQIIGQVREKSSGLKALIITSAKSGIFIAGADIKEIEGITTPEEAIDKAEKGKLVLDDLAKLDLITCAAINGACLGGGMELTLVCKHRVATFSDKVKIGLPEVKLGILPGFGGTVRLPRIVGPARALDMILSGRIISGKNAMKYGLVERLFPEKKLLEETISYVKDLLEGREKKKRKKKKKLFQAFLEDTPLGRAVLFSQAGKNVLKATKGFYPAPITALRVIKKTYGKNLVKSLRLESEAFGELAVTDISKNLIKVFYLIEEYKKRDWAPAKGKPARAQKCGVLGAGVMGGGIAQLVSFRDIPVRVKDINTDALGKALKTAYGLFAYAVKKRKLKIAQAEYKFGLISPTLSYAGFENTDVIIEAVVEDLNIKKKLFKEIGGLTPATTIIASNTSSLPITSISGSMKFPERAVGLHFFNPVHKMPLVEVIPSEKTSDETIGRIVEFARGLGKTVIVVKDVTGFLINRILLSYLNEAGFMAEEGMAMEKIDKLARKFGMPMGPIELIDEIGIDVGLKVAKILEKAYGPRMRVSPILEKAKGLGLLGKKSRRGFYIHKGKKKKHPNPEALAILGKPSGKVISDNEAVERMIYVMINEAARCLEEKAADSPGTIDIGMIMGTGFPPFRAGLLRYADTVGLSKIVKALKNFEKELKSERFTPCRYLLGKAERGGRFYEHF